MNRMAKRQLYDDWKCSLSSQKDVESRPDAMIDRTSSASVAWYRPMRSHGLCISAVSQTVVWRHLHLTRQRSDTLTYALIAMLSRVNGKPWRAMFIADHMHQSTQFFTPLHDRCGSCADRRAFAPGSTWRGSRGKQLVNFSLDSSA